MSKSGTIKTFLLLVIVAAAAFAGGYSYDSMVHHEPEKNEALAHENEDGEHDLVATVNEDGEVVWTCSMHPQIQLPEPGKCPICFMDLIPLERKGSEEQTGLREVRLTENAQRLAGIQVEEVRRLSVDREIRMVGKVDYDETRVRSITAWTGGRVDRMYVDYTGDVVKRGQRMVSMYSPELLTAQAELIQARKTLESLGDSKLKLVRNSAIRTVDAAREKLRLLGLTSRQIASIEKSGAPSDHITLYAPLGGIVIKKSVNEGQYVKTGAALYSIADLSTVWVVLEAYESDLPWIELGQQVDFSTEAYPGKSFKGKVVYIDPLVNEKTRTVRVRLSVGNKDGSLKPGMLVRATRSKGSEELATKDTPLVIPASAPLITGKRAVVYVENPETSGAYEGREIVLGPRAGEWYIVKNGLEEGERVVTKGNFKIDSAVQIVARPSMMNPSSIAAPAHDELPLLFASKLKLLDQSFGLLTSTVASGDLEQTHLAFGSFHKELRLVDGSELDGQAAFLWKEYSMLLGNDAMLGAESPDKKRLDEIFSEMKEHYAAFKAALNLDFSNAVVDAPDTFKKQIGLVFAEYEPLARALSEDSETQARTQALLLATALQKVNADELSGPAHNIWTKALKKINNGLEAIRAAEDIVAIRAGFEPISTGLAEAISKLGISSDSAVFELSCPMAFDYEGATWLQRDEEIRNPYFGSAMLNCGEVNQQLKQ